MTTRKTTVNQGEAPTHSTYRDWEAVMLDHAAIQKRAQEMRSEAAWSIARAVRDWAVTVFGQGKAKARAAAQAPLERNGQPT